MTQSQTDAWNGTCPRCGSVRAYEGFSKWECPKDGCDFFSAKQKKLVDDELELRAKIQKEYDRDTEPGENLELDLEKQDSDAPGAPDDDAYLDAVAYGYGMFAPPAPPPIPPVGPTPPPPPPAKDSDDKKQQNDDDLDMYPYDLADLPDLNLD